MVINKLINTLLYFRRLSGPTLYMEEEEDVLSQAAKTFVRVGLKSTSPPQTTSSVCKIENSKTDRVEIAKKSLI